MTTRPKNLSEVAQLATADLPQIDLPQLWALIHDSTEPEPPGQVWNPQADQARTQLQQSLIRLLLNAAAPVNIHLELTRPMPRPADQNDPYRQAHHYQEADQLARAMRGFGLPPPPDFLAPPEIHLAREPETAAALPRLLPLELQDRWAKTMQAIACQQQREAARAASQYAAWNESRGRAQLSNPQEIQNRLADRLTPIWSQEQPPTLEQWLATMPTRSWLTRWLKSEASRREQAAQLYQDAWKETQRYGRLPSGQTCRWPNRPLYPAELIPA